MGRISLNPINAILLSILLWGVWLIFFISKNNRNKKGLLKIIFLRLMLFVYIGFIVGLTLFPILIPAQKIVEEVYINLNIFNLFEYGLNKIALLNILGNLLLFTPLIILISLNNYKIFDKLHKALLFGVILSLIIEFMQYIEICFGFADKARSIDINDVILNTLGAIIGFIISRRVVYKFCVNNNNEKMFIKNPNIQ